VLHSYFFHPPLLGTSTGLKIFNNFKEGTKKPPFAPKKTAMIVALFETKYMIHEGDLTKASLLGYHFHMVSLDFSWISEGIGFVKPAGLRIHPASHSPKSS